MQTLPPLPSNHIQIATDAVSRIPSNGGGAYAQQPRWEKPGLSAYSTQEKEIEEDDARDVKRKQVLWIDPDLILVTDTEPQDFQGQISPLVCPSLYPSPCLFPQLLDPIQSFHLPN